MCIFLMCLSREMYCCVYCSSNQGTILTDNSHCSHYLCSHNGKHIAYTFVKMKTKSTYQWLVYMNFCFFFEYLCIARVNVWENIWVKDTSMHAIITVKINFPRNEKKNANNRKILKFKLNSQVWNNVEHWLPEKETLYFFLTEFRRTT